MKINEIEKNVWIQNWVLKCPLSLCSLYGDLYTKQMMKHLGLQFNNTVYTFVHGVGTQYLVDNELRSFAESLARKIESEISIGEKYCAQVIARTDSIMKLLAALEKKKQLAATDFIKLQEALYEHICPNLVIKRSADYLKPEILEKLLPDFEKARLYTEHVYPRAISVLFLFANQINKNGKYPLAHLLTHEEIIDYFNHHKLPASDEMEKRLEGVALYYQKGAQAIFIEEGFTAVHEILTKPKEEGIIRGKSAFPGTARGVVRVILDPHQAKDFNKGDVLVTGMTRPDFLPLMEKASAFVTDAGGVLSHAAIVARELKKPCIIGTEIATKVLKDGQIVEVDATHGIIKTLTETFK